MYPTLKARVHKGRIELVEKIALPEDAAVLVTVLEEIQPEMLTLDEHLARGLEDMARGRTTKVRAVKELKRHLDSIFGEN